MKSLVGATLRDIGHATVLWNHIEEGWYLIFGCLLSTTPRSAVDAIYKRFESGHQHRLLVLAVAGAVLAENDSTRTRLGQLQARTNDAAGVRNALIHGDYHIAISGGDDDQSVDLRIGRGGSRGKDNKLGLQDLRTPILDHIAQLKDLCRDIEALRIELAGGPYRPQTSIPELIAKLLEGELEGYKS